MIYNIIASIIGKSSDGEVKRLFTINYKESLWHENYVCAYCGQQILKIVDAEVDHKKTFSKGGNTELSNAQLLHKYCNREKNAIEETIDFEDEE